jgi:hypothetical protein
LTWLRCRSSRAWLSLAHWNSWKQSGKKRSSRTCGFPWLRPLCSNFYFSFARDLGVRFLCEFLYCDFLCTTFACNFCLRFLSEIFYCDFWVRYFYCDYWAQNLLAVWFCYASIF